MPEDQSKLKDEIVKLKLEHIEASLSEFKETQLRQNERVEKKIDALVSVVSTLETLKQSDARQTVEIFQAQKTANEAKDGLAVLKEEVKAIENRRKEDRERISPWRGAFISGVVSVVMALIFGVLYLLGFKKIN